MAEMAAKAHEISLEAGSRMTATMREVIGAAAGLTAFAIESARDLVQYMVRRGQMSQDEADKLMREVEAAHGALPKPALKTDAAKGDATRKAPAESAISHVAHPVVPKVRPPSVEPPAPKVAAKAEARAKAPPTAKAAPMAKAPTKAPAKAPAKAPTKDAEKTTAKSAPPAKTATKAPAKPPTAKAPPKKR